MSIINQTLRALDARQPSSTPPPLLGRPAAAAKPRRTGLWIIAAVLLPLAGAGIWFVSRPAERLPQPRAGAAQRTVIPQAAIPHAAMPAPSAVPLPAVQSRVQAPTKAQAPAVLAEHLPLPPDSNEQKNQPAPTVPIKLTAASATMKAPPGTDKTPAIRKEDRQPTIDEQAEERYRRALTLIRKGRENQARPLLEEAIDLSPGHVAARETLAALLSDAGRNQEAEALLRTGRALNPEHAWFALSLARLQAARGDTEDAVATLRSGMGGRGVNAEYHATLAGFLVGIKQYPDAARQYEQALELQPGQAVWWMGLGLSREAQGKSDEARSAYRRALAAGNLPDKLAEFVRAKLGDQGRAGTGTPSGHAE